MQAIADKIIELYGGSKYYKLPAIRKAKAAQLLNLIEQFHDCKIIEGRVDPFYIKLLKMIFVRAHEDNKDFKAEHAYNEALLYRGYEFTED